MPHEDQVLTRVVWIDPKTNLRHSQFYETHMGCWELRRGVLQEKGVACSVDHFTDAELDAALEFRRIKEMLPAATIPRDNWPERNIIFSDSVPAQFTPASPPKPVSGEPPIVLADVRPKYLHQQKCDVDLSGLELPKLESGQIVFNPNIKWEY